MDKYLKNKCEQKLATIDNNKPILYETDNNTITDLKTITCLFVMIRVLFFIILLYCKYIANIQYESGSVYLIYDGVHYFDIAINGYTEAYQYAFFPLFPLVIRFFSFINIPITGTLIINHLMTLIIAYLLYFTGRNILNRDHNVSLMMSKFWIFSPIAISTCILYSESLFVLLTLSTYYMYKKKRYLPAGILLGLSVAARNTGSMLFFSIFIVMLVELILRKNKSKINNIFLMYIPATLISCLYPSYLFLKIGSWRYFIDVQYQYWGRLNSNLFSVLFNDLKMINVQPIHFAFTYISLIICFYIICNSLKEKKNYELIFYAIFSLLAIYSTSRMPGSNMPSTSYYRYFYGIFSLYLLVSDKIKMKIIILINMVMCIFAMVYYCFGGFLI